MVKKTKAVFVKKEDDVSKFIEEVDTLPQSTRKNRDGKYSKIVDAVAKSKKGNYRIKVKEMGLLLKTAYPSMEKVIMSIAKRNNVDFTKVERKNVETKKGARTYTSYPEFKKWKENNLRLRVVNGELYIEKLTDKLL